MKLSYMGIGDGKSFRVVNASDFYRELNALKGRYAITVEHYHRKKSNPQLGYYYGVVLPHFHKAAIEQGWEFADINELDNYLKSMFASKDVINKHTGELIAVPGLKRDMTAAEMVAFTDSIKDYCQDFLGYRIPEPNEQLQLI